MKHAEDIDQAGSRTIEDQMLFESWYRPGTDACQVGMEKLAAPPNVGKGAKPVKRGLGGIKEMQSGLYVVLSDVAGLFEKVAPG